MCVRCDALEVGDVIVSVNGVKTAMLTHNEIVDLVRTAPETVVLEVQYDLPDPRTFGRVLIVEIFCCVCLSAITSMLSGCCEYVIEYSTL